MVCVLGTKHYLHQIYFLDKEDKEESDTEDSKYQVN